MKRFFILLTVSAVHLSLSAQTGKEAVAGIDSIIMPLVRTNNYSGTVLVSKNGKIILSKAYGKMSREYGLSNTTDTKFFLASVSMIFTSAAVLKLAEENKLALSDPLSKFIPGYKNGNNITVHDMLSQRSGIPPIGANGKVDYDSITKFTHSLDQLISYFKDDDLLFKTGSKYNHGRSDYILLAYIIEKVSGKSFGQFLQDDIFLPLGMRNSGHCTGETEIIPHLAKGYAPKELYDVESAYQIDWSSKTGHASIYSTSGDLQKFAQAALENKLLKKASWDKIFTDYGNNVGYSWFITQHLNRTRLQMNGRAPGYSSYIGLYPKDQLTVIILSNNYISLPADMGKSVAALVLHEPFERLNLTNNKPNSVFAPKLAGTYRFDEKFYRPNYELEVYYKDGYMTSAWGGLIPIDKGDNNFREYILRNYWSSIRFIENEKGEITGMMCDSYKGVKIK